MKRIAVIQHSPHEGLGRITDWLQLRELEHRLYRPFSVQALPDSDSFDLLILLGGAMNAADEQRFAWLAEEKQLIKDAIEQGKRLLGLGLGCQLLAQALGATVEPLGQWQIGWWPLEKSPQSQQSPIGRMLPQRLLPLHWHSQGFSLPEGAVPLYNSPNGMQQSFVWDERVVGLQFHMECTPQSIESLLNQYARDLTQPGEVQDSAAIQDGALLSSSLRMPLYRMLDYLSGPHAVLC